MSAVCFAAWLSGRATYRWGMLELKLRDYVHLNPKTAFVRKARTRRETRTAAQACRLDRRT